MRQVIDAIVTFTASRLGLLWLLVIPVVVAFLPGGWSVALSIVAGYLVAAAVLLVVKVAARLRNERQEYVVPRELPPKPVLIGRSTETADLSRRLSPSAVVGIWGPAGIGKTVLALHIAHGVREQYPDGQLFARLRSSEDPRATTITALKQFIWALQGPWDNEPDDDLDHLVTRYRKLVRFRRVLVVLDDATSPSTIENLLPLGADCATVITSQHRFDVAGTSWTELGALEPDAGQKFLAAVVGGDLAGNAEPGPAGEVAERARHLPQALRLVGNLVAARSSADLTTSFRLLELPPGANRETPLDLGYALMTSEEQRAVQLLGLLRDSEALAPWMLTCLPDLSGDDARVLANRLVQVGLVERVAADRAPGLVEYHVLDHARRYARDIHHDPRLGDRLATARAERARSPRAAALTEVERLQEAGRLADALAVVADVMAWAIETDRPDELARSQVIAAELHVELGDLEAAEDLVEAAARSPRRRIRVRVMGVAARILRRQGQPRLAGRIITDALWHLDASNLDDAERAAERIRLLRHRAEARLDEGRVAGAATDLADATRLVGELADEARPAARTSLVWLRASIELRRHQTTEAVASLTEAAAAAEWHRVWHAWITLELARAQLATDQPARAEELVQDALRSFVRMGHRYGKAKAHTVLADIRMHEEQPERAVAELERALETMRNCGDRWAEATAALYLIDLLPDGDRSHNVEALLRAAGEGFGSVGDHAQAQEVHRQLRTRAWRRLLRPSAVPWTELFARPRSRADVRWSGLIAATAEAGDR